VSGFLTAAHIQGYSVPFTVYTTEIMLSDSGVTNNNNNNNNNKLCGRPPQYAPPSVTLTFDILTLKVVSKSRVTWATSVPILVFPAGLSVLDLGPMYATDRQTSDVRRASSLNAPYPRVKLISIAPWCLRMQKR